MAEKSKISPSQNKDEGVLRINCPACGQGFRYRRGRVKNPTLKEINEYYEKAQCPHCGQPLKVRTKLTIPIKKPVSVGQGSAQKNA